MNADVKWEDGRTTGLRTAICRSDEESELCSVSKGVVRLTRHLRPDVLPVGYEPQVESQTAQPISSFQLITRGVLSDELYLLRIEAARVGRLDAQTPQTRQPIQTLQLIT